MANPLRRGFSFGLTSGIITTLGLMVGLHAGTHSKPVVIGGIVTIAIADALSDAFGVHMFEEAGGKNKRSAVFKATISTFVSKLVFASTFILPVFFLALETAVWVSILWGLFCLTLLSLYLARKNNLNPAKVAGEHLVMALLVIILTRWVGAWIESKLGG